MKMNVLKSKLSSIKKMVTFKSMDQNRRFEGIETKINKN